MNTKPPGTVLQLILTIFCQKSIIRHYVLKNLSDSECPSSLCGLKVWILNGTQFFRILSVFGSTWWLFFFCCRGQSDEVKNTGITLDTRPESRNNESTKKMDPTDRNPSKDPLARMEKTVRLHCINLQMAVKF